MTKNAPAGRRANRARDIESIPASASPPAESTNSETAVPAVNVTPHLIALGPVRRLRDLFVLHVNGAAAYDKLRRQRGETTISTSYLDKVLAERLATIDEMTRQDFVDAFTFFDGFTNQWIDESRLVKARAALRLDTTAKTRLVTVNRWLKYVYMMMWVEGVVRFPLAFRKGVCFSKKELRTFLPPVAACHLDNPDSHTSAFGVALVLSTGWRSFSDIDLDEIGPLSAEIVLGAKAGKVGGLRKHYPSYDFSSAIVWMAKAGQGLGFRYSLKDIKSYRYWMERNRRGFDDPKPSEFIVAEEDIRRAQAQTRKDTHMRRIAAAQLDLIEDENREDFRQSILDGKKRLQDVKFEALANKVNAPEDIRAYMQALRAKGNFRNRANMYPTRMHAFPTELWARWHELFEEFYAYRRRQGYESGSGDESHRIIFRDYLCVFRRATLTP